MKEIIKPGMWKIMKLFYEKRNSHLHLRQIARETEMNESIISKYLNILEENKIMKSQKIGNLKQFSLTKNKIPEIFPIFDYEKIEALPLLRKNIIKYFIRKLEEKPVLVVVFGSTASGNFNKNSDVDILIVSNSEIDFKNAKEYSEKQTGIIIQIFQTNLYNFKENLINKKDKLLSSATDTGFPVFNNKYFYEVVYNE